MTGIVAAGVTPVAVAWGIGSLRLLDALVLQGAWPTPVVGELVVSDALLSTNPATPAGLGALLPFVPEVDASWSLMCALGSVLPLAELALDAGLGISVGLGDHPHTELGAPTNAELVARAAELVVAAGHRVAGPAEARGLLGLPPTLRPRSGPGTARSAPGATSAIAAIGAIGGDGAIGRIGVELMGLEPTTPCLQSRCSSQLSYSPGRAPS